MTVEVLFDCNSLVGLSRLSKHNLPRHTVMPSCSALCSHTSISKIQSPEAEAASRQRKKHVACRMTRPTGSSKVCIVIGQQKDGGVSSILLKDHIHNDQARFERASKCRAVRALALWRWLSTNVRNRFKAKIARASFPVAPTARRWLWHLAGCPHDLLISKILCSDEFVRQKIFDVFF